MAFAVLFSWPIVVAILFKRLPLKLALIVAILGGHLLLPSEGEIRIDLPLLPPIDKLLIPVVAAMVMAVLTVRSHEQAQMRRGPKPPPIGTVLPGWLPRSKVGFVLTLMLILGTVMTVLTNGDTLRYPGVVLPAQRPYDIFSQLLYWGVIFLPLILGRKYLADFEGHRLLLLAMCFGAFAYSFFTLYEIRMSPRINQMVYGFFPHNWLQHQRGGGWRPIVFLNHGLVVGIFMASAVIATATLVRISKGAKKAAFGVLLLWLTAALFLGKTLGALVLAIILVPLALLAPVRIQLLMAAIIAGVVMLYPMLRGAGVVPVEDVVAFFEGVDAERAGSLQYRLGHEDALLAHAQDRPWFGWSGWSRWRIFDPETGEDLTTADGFWVITIGESGWIGYIARFGLFCVPIMLFFLNRKRFDVGLVTSGLCLVTAANLFDLIPNTSGATTIFFLTVGALLGRLELSFETDTEPEAVPAGRAEPPPELAGTRYSRFAATHTRGEP